MVTLTSFHMIPTIAEIKLKFTSAIVVSAIATISEEWFPYDRFYFFQRSQRS